jgi:hypothetical protein
VVRSPAKDQQGALVNRGAMGIVRRLLALGLVGVALWFLWSTRSGQ